MQLVPTCTVRGCDRHDVDFITATYHPDGVANTAWPPTPVPNSGNGPTHPAATTAMHTHDITPTVGLEISGMTAAQLDTRDTAGGRPTRAGPTRCGGLPRGGWPADQGRALPDRLLAWSTQPRFTLRHKWRKGDLVMWDSTGMLHRALAFESTSIRLMHRTTLVGEERVAAA